MARLDINIIRVGSDLFTSDDEWEIGQAIHFTRNTYGTVGISLWNVVYWSIPRADTEGLYILGYEWEAQLLTSKWTTPNRGVDIFVVKYFDYATAGLSPVKGPCDKNAPYPPYMTGVVVEINPGLTSQIMAHEVGHYLGLGHRPGDSTNLMYESTPNGGLLDSSQGATMRSHTCFVYT